MLCILVLLWASTGSPTYSAPDALQFWSACYVIVWLAAKHGPESRKGTRLKLVIRLSGFSLVGSSFNRRTAALHAADMGAIPVDSTILRHYVQHYPKPATQ